MIARFRIDMGRWSRYNTGSLDIMSYRAKEVAVLMSPI